jgi:hypothetical protein
MRIRQIKEINDVLRVQKERYQGEKKGKNSGNFEENQKKLKAERRKEN